MESFIGGLPIEDDKKKLKGCHVAIGAPGRIKHLIESRLLKTEQIKLFVLDEADKLVDASFQADINQIFHKLPIKKQVIASSATYPEQLDAFLARYMCCPTYISADVDGPLLLGLRQYVNIVKAHANVVQQLKIKNERLNEILSKVSFTQCLIFTNYQTRAESVSNILNQKGWNSSFISAAQNQKKRLEVVNDLRKFNCRILLSTDLTSRGIDVAKVDLVVNYDVPYDASTYLHRMGRAGRYGSKGVCITICSDGKELREFRYILAVIAGPGSSIAKLEEIPSDLLNCDCQSFEQIFGEVNNVDEIKEASLKVKNSVMDLKSQNNINAESKKKKKNQKQNSIAKENFELNPETAKTLLEEEQKEDINADMSKMDLFSLLQSIGDNRRCESEKRDEDTKLENTITISEAATTSTNTNEVFQKNIFLYNITKLLLNQHNGDTCINHETVNLVAKNLKKFDVDDRKKIHKIEEKLRKVSTEEMLKDIEKCFYKQKEQPLDDESVLEKIFTNAYAYACGETNEHWLKLFSVKLQTEFHEICNPSISDSESDYEYDDYQAEEEEEEEYATLDESEHIIEESSPETVGNVKIENLQNLHSELQNDEKSQEIDFVERYSAYFNECARILEENALTFDNLESFDNWFYYDWQAKVANVREYVRQNIYVHEMSEYQKNRDAKR